MQAYCVKCHTTREMKNAKSVTMKNGRPATKGVCPACGTKMYRIGKNGARAVRVETTGSKQIVSIRCCSRQSILVPRWPRDKEHG